MDPQTGIGARPGLLLMPLEVLLAIVERLTTLALGNLRLTCKHLEASLLNSFTREYFTKRQFMLTELSLQALVDISKSRFASSITHVIISAERPSFAQPPHRDGTIANFGVNGQIPGNTTIDQARQANRYRQEVSDHFTLVDNGQDVEMLTEAFRNLVNLDTVGLRDFNSRRRNRDFPQNEWRSYGASTYERETGSILELVGRTPPFGMPPAPGRRLWPDQLAFLSHIFHALLRATGKASSQLKVFQIILRHSGLPDHAFSISKYLDPVIQPVLHNLQTLFLDLRSDIPAAWTGADNNPKPCYSYFLRKFLSRVPNLEFLRLNFRQHNAKDAQDLLFWLAQTSNATSSTAADSLLDVPPAVSFPNLKQFEIGMVEVDKDALLAVIQKYRKTLSTISFHKVTLTRPSSQSLERVNLWVRFFNQLSKLDVKLTCMNMSMLSQNFVEGHRVGNYSKIGTQTNLNEKSWKGQDFESACKDFAQSFHEIDWPDENMDSHTDDSEDEDEVASDDSSEDSDEEEG